jgi:hypothetical protein
VRTLLICQSAPRVGGRWRGRMKKVRLSGIEVAQGKTKRQSDGKCDEC